MNGHSKNKNASKKPKESESSSSEEESSSNEKASYDDSQLDSEDLKVVEGGNVDIKQVFTRERRLRSNVLQQQQKKDEVEDRKVHQRQLNDDLVS